MRRVAVGAVVAAVALACAACAPQHGSDGSFSAGASGSASPAAADAGETSQAPTAQADPASACPVGAWILDNDSWDTALTALFVQTLPDSQIEILGELWLDWNADGTYVLTATNSTYIVTGISDGVAFTQTILHNGTESGTWAHAGGDVYELVATDESTWDSSVTMEAEGASYSVDQSTLPADPWSGSMTVTCGPGSMTTEVTEAEGTIAVDFLTRSR